MDRYAVIVDAGSSGSRVHVYSWKNTPEPTDNSSLVSVTSNKDWVQKVNPGVSAYQNSLETLWDDHLKPLVRKAESVVPAKARRDSPIYFLATAGLRVLPEESQDRILARVCTLLKEKTNFYLPECASHVTLIDGKVESLYGWLSVNYLLKNKLGRWNALQPNEIYGFMDMGGGSAQIAFVPSENEATKHKDALCKLKMVTLAKQQVEFDVFASTWLGFGANLARKSYDRLLASNLVAGALDAVKAGVDVPILDPCMPRSEIETRTISTGDSQLKAILYGTGDFHQCQTNLMPLLGMDECTLEPCPFNGVDVPAFDFTQQKFIGVSEYWYTAENVFGMKGHFNYNHYVERAAEFCNMSWSDIQHEREKGTYGALSEEKLRQSCFKAAWVLSILHNGFKFPLDSVHPGHEPDREFIDTFQSVFDVEGNEVTWTLGRAVLYASSQIAPELDTGIIINDTLIPGGELSAQPMSSATNQETHPSAYAVMLFVVVVIIYYACLRWSPSLVYLRRLYRRIIQKSQGYAPILPIAKEADEIGLEQIRQGLSSSTVPSRTPSRIASRLNVWEE